MHKRGLVKDDAITAFLCGYRLGHKDGMRVARKRAEEMGRPCTNCAHDHRDEIDRELVDGIAAGK